MVTSVQIDDETKKELVKYASILQGRLGRKISFDQAIRASLAETKGLEEARKRFDSLYGSLSGEKGIWTDLERERKAERKAIEKKANPA
ncbi:MAG TPA: hypothetical protein VN739_09425 [Nitrososphaerales archaeon]|nr:hypothetical protein [Nitrososphaerales archaeon]